MSAIFTSFSHTHHGVNTINLGFVKHGYIANSAWQAFVGKAKMEQCLGGGLLSLSLSLSLLALFSTLKFFKRFIFGLLRPFCHFEPLQKGDPTGCKAQAAAKKSTKIKENLPFLDTSLALSMTANASLRAVFAKTAWQSINLALFLLFGLPRSLCSLAMTARHKFKFFTQNSRYFINLIHFVNSTHFTNSTHFITLSQISSHTQGFFIFLPQVFAQFLLINSLQRSSYERQSTKAPF